MKSINRMNSVQSHAEASPRMSTNMPNKEKSELHKAVLDILRNSDREHAHILRDGNVDTLSILVAQTYASTPIAETGRKPTFRNNEDVIRDPSSRYCTDSKYGIRIKLGSFLDIVDHQYTEMLSIGRISWGESQAEAWERCYVVVRTDPRLIRDAITTDSDLHRHADVVSLGRRRKFQIKKIVTEQKVLERKNGADMEKAEYELGELGYVSLHHMDDRRTIALMLTPEQSVAVRALLVSMQQQIQVDKLRKELAPLLRYRRLKNELNALIGHAADYDITSDDPNAQCPAEILLGIDNTLAEMKNLLGHETIRRYAECTNDSSTVG